MKASVVLPVYNKAPWLQECLDSVFTQTFTDFEVIAVDDASTDDGLALLRSVDDPRLRIIALERNVGPGGAAQRGMDAAQGEYILRVDADDIMLPGRFEKQVALLDGDPGLGACSGHLQLLNDPTVLHRVELEDAACKARMLFGVPLNQPATAYRRDVLVRHDIRFQDQWPVYGEDWMQQLELSRVTRFRNLDEPLILYRTGAMNISSGRDRAADLRYLYRHVFDRLGLPITDEEIELQLYTVKCFPHPLTADRVLRFRKWLQHLATMNRTKGLFNEQELQRLLDRLWDELYYRLPAFGLSPTIAHLGTGRVSGAKLYYLMAALLSGRVGEHPRA